MELFTALGIDSTLYLQIGVFLVTFVFLKYVLFDPYFAAFTEHSRQTVGQVDEAEQYIQETKRLQEDYSLKARKINEEYKNIYDKTRSEALKIYEERIVFARNKAKEDVDAARAQISKAAEAAKKEIKQELPQISEMISSRLLGKDLH